MKFPLIIMIFLFLFTASCTKKLSNTLRDSNSIVLDHRILPNKKYSIKSFWWSINRTHNFSSESKTSFEFLFDSKNLDEMEMTTIDSIFYSCSVGYNFPLMERNFNIIPHHIDEDPSLCYTSDNRIIIASDSLLESYNSIGMRTWNRQSELPKGSFKIGELIKTESSQKAYNYNSDPPSFITTTTNEYSLDSISNGVGIIAFNIYVHKCDSIPELIRHEYGTIEYDNEQQYFRKIERYIDDNPLRKDGSNSAIRLDNPPTHDIVEIRIVE